MSTSFTVSGPSPLLAMLRSVALKAAGYARTAWAHVRLAVTTAVRIPKAVATAGLAFLASDTGYRAVVRSASAVVGTASRAVGAVLRFLGRTVTEVGNTAARLVGRVSPKAEARLRTAARTIARPVRNAAAWTASFVSMLGVTVEHLAMTPLVRRTATVAAKVAGIGVLAHLVSKGALAAKVLTVLPQAAGFVAAVTNPWVALGAVGAATLASMGLALFRLMKAAKDQSFDSQPEGTDEPEGQASQAPQPDAVDLEQIARTLNVVVDVDGSVVVEGIPAELPEDLKAQVAQLAADAATAQLKRILRHRRVPTRDDRRLFTKVAREAVAAEARRKATGQHEMPYAA